MPAEQYAAIFWLVLAVALFILEGLSVQLISIWFAAGSIFAMVAALLGGSTTVQLLVFLVTSIAVLIFGRPFFKQRLNLKKSPTNADLVIGQIGIVLEEINNDLQTGRVNANGLDWTARSTDDAVSIPVGSRVMAMRIEGVKLIVQPVQEPAGTAAS